MKPTLNRNYDLDLCGFRGIQENFNINDFVATSLGVPEPKEENRQLVYDPVYTVVEINKHWHISQSRLYIRTSNGRWYSECDGTHAADAMAYPIDPTMTREDIEGATRIEPNDDNTGWLFFHASAGHHKDHEVAVMAGIEGYFSPPARQFQVDAILAGDDSARTLAKQRQVLWAEYYGQVVSAARTIARAAHLGKRHKDPHPEDGHVASDIRAALAQVKAKWTTTRADHLTKLATAIRYVDRGLAIPNPETPWDERARLKREAAEQAAQEGEQQQ